MSVTVAQLLAMPLDEAIELVTECARAKGLGIKPSTPLMMTKKDYEVRSGFCTRKLDELLSSDCYVGEGREKRIIVERADACLLERLARGPVRSNVIDLAIANARRGHK